MQLFPFHTKPGAQEIFSQPLLTKAIPEGQEGAGEQVSLLITVREGQTHNPLLATKGSIHILLQLVPFQAVLEGQVQIELILSKMVPPLQVIH